MPEAINPAINSDLIPVPDAPVVGKAMGSAYNFSRFTPQRKRLFIAAARRYYPNITKCCEVVGISWPTFNLHRKQDKSFADKIAEIDREVTDRIEGVMATEAVNPKSFLDRMAYLRAHRPELYDRAKVVKIEGYKMGEVEKKNRLAVVEGAIDAEIVKTYLDRKQIREQRQAKKLESGEGKAGGETAGGARE